MSEYLRMLQLCLSRSGHHRVERLSSRIHFALAQYHSFADVINYLNALALTYPEKVSVQPIGTTHEGRQIPLIKITNKRLAGLKKGIWIDGGIHAREWISPATVLYFIHMLVTQYDKDPQVQEFVDNIEWYIVPLLNPDGYEYSRSSSNPEIRLWRKNRSPPKCIQQSTGLFTVPRTVCCQGVDLNRNFDWFFGQVGSSTDPCSEIYQGAYAFSEPEAASVRDFLQRHAVHAFLTFHSYSQILMYPFGHQIRTYSSDFNDLRSTALSASSHLQRMFGTTYKVGTGADTLYPASGGSEDWAKGRAHVKYSYLFELRPEEQVWDGFLLSENQIMPTARETWEAVKVIALQTLALPVVARPRHCVDRDALCASWAESGACSSWPEMKQRCPLSCGVCLK
uniref:ShKT domain-containing protein n=1 Tax=Angiostrongylus cantonensis TaxID=6313 RepID=A0A158PB88_ANGCA